MQDDTEAPARTLPDRYLIKLSTETREADGISTSSALSGPRLDEALGKCPNEAAAIQDTHPIRFPASCPIRERADSIGRCSKYVFLFSSLAEL